MGLTLKDLEEVVAPIAKFSQQEISFDIGALAITDLEVSYKLPLDVTVSMGASNLFNKYPDKLSAAFVAACVASGSGCVAQYPSYSPVGINGGYYYGRLTWNF